MSTSQRITDCPTALLHRSSRSLASGSTPWWITPTAVGLRSHLLNAIWVWSFPCSSAIECHYVIDLTDNLKAPLPQERGL